MNNLLTELVADLHNQARKIEAFEQKECFNIASAIRRNADQINAIEKSMANKIRVLEKELLLKKILINNSCIQDNLTRVSSDEKRSPQHN